MARRVKPRSRRDSPHGRRDRTPGEPASGPPPDSASTPPSGGEPAPDAAADEPEDGRRTRWREHRESRREQLVLAAVAAIDRHGPTVSIGQIAAEAGVSKPVLYRHFTDKDDIHTAVGQWGATLVLERLLPPLLSDQPVRARVSAAVDAYLATIEEHPSVFLLLVRHRVGADVDPLADGKAGIASMLARVLGDSLRELGVDAGGAEPWAHGLVGLGLATGEWWLDRRTMSRSHVGAYLSDFVWHALEGVAAGYGVRLDAEGGLRLIRPAEEDVPEPPVRPEARPGKQPHGQPREEQA
jgi:AcrR family transcriptional regulator